MTTPETIPPAGSNQGAAQIFLTVVAGSILVGFLWSLLGPVLPLIGTWKGEDGFDILRFEADGTYWHRTTEGLLQLNLVGTYEIVGSSAGTYRIHTHSELGDLELQVRLDSPERLAIIDPDEPEESDYYRRVGDWILARRPSSSASNYDGHEPHLGCWQRQSSPTPALTFQKGGVVLLHGEQGSTGSTYAVDYREVPFRLDLTRSNGEVERAIFEFTADGALRLSRSSTGKDRPESFETFQSLVPCPTSSPSNAQGEQDVR